MEGLTANVTDDEFTVVGVVVDKEPDASTKYTNHCVSLPPGVQLKLTESEAERFRGALDRVCDNPFIQDDDELYDDIISLSGHLEGAVYTQSN